MNRPPQSPHGWLLNDYSFTEYPGPIGHNSALIVRSSMLIRQELSCESARLSKEGTFIVNEARTWPTLAPFKRRMLQGTHEIVSNPQAAYVVSPWGPVVSFVFS
jgi:hypothetical protein